MNKIINHDRLLKQFFIVDTFDKPCERHVAQLRAGQLFYIAPELSDHGGMTDIFSTPLEDFGFHLSVENGMLECIQIAPSTAQYDDGKQRKWQGSARFSIKLDCKAIEGVLAIAADKMVHAKCEAKEIASELERVKAERDNLIAALEYVAHSGLTARHLADFAAEVLNNTKQKEAAQ